MNTDADAVKRNPFESKGVASSYDMSGQRQAGSVTMLQAERFVYPSVFGSSGGDNFLRLLRLLDSVKDGVSSMLELGCGAGAFFETLRMNGFQQAYVGLDASATEIGLARRNYPDTRFEIGDAATLPFADNQFDCVFENNLFPFLIDPEKAIREMVRVSRRHVWFNCHATPVAGGIHAWQPIFVKVECEIAPDGMERLSLPETLDPALRPSRVMPGVLRETASGGLQAAIAKVKKTFMPIARLRSLLDELGVEVLECRVTPVGKYPAILNEALAVENSRVVFDAQSDDCVIEDGDILLTVDAMDAACVLRLP